MTITTALILLAIIVAITSVWHYFSLPKTKPAHDPEIAGATGFALPEVSTYPPMPTVKPPKLPRGFKSHSGNKCPVKTLTIVDVMFRDGSIHRNQQAWGANRSISLRLEKKIIATSYAGGAFWEQTGHTRDIVAYRVRQPRKTTKRRSTK